MKSLRDWIAIVGPVVLAVVGLVMAMQPKLVEGYRRQAFVVILIAVVAIFTVWATKKANDELEDSITGGDNYAFMTIDKDAPTNPERRVPLMLTNCGPGAVYNVKIWMYPGSSQADPHSIRYKSGWPGFPFDWVNPGHSYSAGLAVLSGDYMIEVEARNGEVVEHLHIGEEQNKFIEVISVQRDSQVIRTTGRCVIV